MGLRSLSDLNVATTSSTESSITNTGKVSVTIDDSTVTDYVAAVSSESNYLTQSKIINTGDKNVKIQNGSNVGYVDGIYNTNTGNSSTSTVANNGKIDVAISDSTFKAAFGIASHNDHESSYLSVTNTGDVTLSVINSSLSSDADGSAQAISSRDSYIKISPSTEGQTANVNLFVKDLLTNPNMEKDNLAGVSGSFVPKSTDVNAPNFQIDGDINVTFIASKQFVEGVQNYSGGFGSNIYGAHVTSGELEHKGNVNVSLGGAAQNLNLKDSSVYGSFDGATGATYTQDANKARTLIFGATDENGNNVAYTSNATNQFNAPFANFDKVVVETGSSLYIGDGQTENYYQQGSATVAAKGVDAENGQTPAGVEVLGYNKAIMSYGGKFIMKGANTVLEIRQNASMDVNELNTVTGSRIDITGGRLNLNGNSSIKGSLENAGTLSINRGTTTVETLNSTGGVLDIASGAQLNISNDLTNKEKVTTATINSAESNQLAINNMKNEDSGSLAVNLTKNAANALSGTDANSKVTSATKVVSFGAGSETKGYQLSIAEGDIFGAIFATIGNDGTVQSIRETQNNTISSLTDLAFNNFQVFRSQMNDLDKRMGDLRTMPTASGAWARAIAGQSQYKTIHNTYKTLQVGVDHRMGNFFGGAMASYTDGEGTLRLGDTDDKNYNFGLYDGYLADNGMFVDVTVKRHHVASDYDLRYQSGDKVKGSYHTSGTSVSLETGWRLPITNTIYVEP